ncbi:winged helix-turn-helix domain-containing protein [Mesoterricola silvestris]|nr:LysR family transcriptional regulator [Mesoterricola silvestris]
MTAPAKKIVSIGIPMGDHYAMGPGKADLLEAIQETGSISAAGRKLGMSYRRAWLLVDEMNACFREAVVATRLGGVKGGGAVVTDLGLEAVRRYRALQTLAWDAVQPSVQEFQRLLGHPAGNPAE